MSERLLILPLRNLVILPSTQIPLLIGRDSSISLVEEAWRTDKIIGTITQKDAELDDPGPEGLYSVGTLSKLVGLAKKDKGLRALVEGVQRFKVINYTQLSPYLVAEVALVNEEELGSEAEEMVGQIKHSVLEMVKRLNMPASVAKALEEQLNQSSHPGQLTDRITLFGPFDVSQKQEILETIAIKERLKKFSDLLQGVEVGIDVRQEAGKKVFKTQRAFWLHEQIKAAQKELKDIGEEVVETSPELADLKGKMDKAQMPAEAKKAAEKEFGRLQFIPRLPRSTLSLEPISTG